MNEAFIYILFAFFGCLQHNIEPRAITDHQTSEENKATASDESLALRSEPKSAVVEQDVHAKHQAPNLESSDLDGAPLEDNVASDLLSRYDKQRSTDSDTNKYQGFDEVNLESNVDEKSLHPSKSMSTALHHDLPRQIKLTTYPTVRKKRDSYISSNNPLFSDRFQRLPQPENRVGVLSSSVNPRIKKAVPPEFDSLEGRKNSANYHTTADKQEGSSLNSWKPIHGNKFKSDYFKPEHGTSYSNLKRHDPVKKFEHSGGITDSKRNYQAFNFGVANKKKDETENDNIIAKDVEHNSNNLLHRSSDISQSPEKPKPQGVVKNTVPSNDHDQQEQIPDKSCSNQVPYNIAQTKDETVGTGTTSLGEETSKVIKQVMRNVKDILADTVQKELDPYFEKKDSKREIQSKSDSEKENKKLIKKGISTAASYASNLATPLKNTEKLKDEPLQISLDQDIDNAQALQKRNADPTLIHKQKPAATSLNEVKRSVQLPGTDSVQENDIKNKVSKRNIHKESIMREIILKGNQLKNNHEKKPLDDSGKVSERNNLKEDDKEPGKISEPRSLKTYKSLENTKESKRQSSITGKTEGKLAFTDESSGNEKFDAHKNTEKRLVNRLSKLVGTENKNLVQNVGDTYIEAEDPDKSEVRRETEESDEEHELEDTIAGNDEIEKGIEIGSQRQDPKFIDYSNTHASQTSNPEDTMHHDQHEQQNRKGTSLVSADEEEPHENRNMDDDGDVNYDDLENSEILKNDDSNAQGEQTLYEEKEDGVQRLSQVSAPADIPDDTRIYKRDSRSKYSGNKDETEDEKRTENQIQSRIDALKDNIKREIAKEEIRRKENGEVKIKLEEPAQHTSTLAEQEVEQSNLLDPSINVEELLLPHSSIRKRRETEAEFSQDPTNEMAEVESNIPHSRSKRTIFMSPDPGTEYSPYRAEDDNEDDDEGGEFDDDGFDSRTSNLISRKREVEPVAKQVDQDSEKDFNLDQNARVSSNKNVADDISNFLFSNNDPTTYARRKRELQNFRRNHQVSAFHGGGGGVAHHSHLMKAKTANNNNQEGQSKASDDTRIERSINVEENNQLQNPSANNINLLPQDLSSFSGTNELSQPDGGGEFDDVFGGLSQSSYNGELSRVKRVKREPRKQNPEKFQTETMSVPEVYGN